MFEKFQEKCASDGVSLIAGYEERWRENMKEEDKGKYGLEKKPTPLPLDVGGALAWACRGNHVVTFVTPIAKDLIGRVGADD